LGLQNEAANPARSKSALQICIFDLQERIMMKRLHQGLDYRLYKIYVWGGLPLIAVQILVSTLVFDALSLRGPQAFLVLAGPLLLWLAGIFLYWWWVFLFKGNRDLAELSQAQGQGVPGIKALKSWNTLHQAMAIHGGNVEEFIKNARRANRPILVWYGTVNLLAVWILGPIVLGSLEIINPDWGTVGWVWLGGIFVGIALLLVATPILASWGGRSAERAYLAPLGLALTRTPSLAPDAIGLIGGGQELIPDGPAIVEGERYGRLIHIETIGKHSLTVLQATMPEFKVHSNDGKLVPDKGAPEAVARALKSLRKAKRWRGIVANAGPEGIGVHRKSKGTNMWLYDLWLAEYLLHEINAG
jgi:hypothetical protein